MDVEFRDKTLALIETDRAAETRLPISVINSLRQKLVVIRAAPDERTLRNWKSHSLRKDGRRRAVHPNQQTISFNFHTQHGMQAEQNDHFEGVES